MNVFTFIVFSMEISVSSVDPVQMSQSAEAELGQICLHLSPKWLSQLKFSVKLNCICSFWDVPYFFSYKTVFFFLPNNPKNLDPTFEKDLD